MSTRVLSILLVVACVACHTRPPSPPRQTKLALAISSVTLANGMRVVLVQDPRAAEIQVTARYGVGSVDDPPGQEGVAHLVEHLMFQQMLGAESIFAKLEMIARGFNAFTSFDATSYITQAPVEHLDAVLAIEAARPTLRCSSISEQAFVREREVVVNEMRMRDRSSELYVAFTRGAFPEAHPYTRSASAKSVAGLTMEQACAFADAHYTPGNVVLVVSGSLTKESLARSLEKSVARIQPRDAIAAAQVKRSSTPQRTETSVPIDEDAILLAWPLPASPELRARAIAVATLARGYVGTAVRGVRCR